jgi:hypothetical protein
MFILSASNLLLRPSYYYIQHTRQQNNRYSRVPFSWFCCAGAAGSCNLCQAGAYQTGSGQPLRRANSVACHSCGSRIVVKCVNLRCPWKRAAVTTMVARNLIHGFTCYFGSLLYRSIALQPLQCRNILSRIRQYSIVYLVKISGI